MQVYPAAGLLEFVKNSAKLFIVDPIKPVIPARFLGTKTFYAEGYENKKTTNNAIFIEKKATEGVLDLEEFLCTDIEQATT